MIAAKSKRVAAERVAKYADMFTAMGTEPRLRIMQLLLSAHPDGLIVGEIGEEHPPRAVIPGDVVGHQQQHVFFGGRAHDGDSQRCVGGKVEGREEFALSQHFEAKPACLF